MSPIAQDPFEGRMMVLAIKLTFGLRERGRQADGPFDHKTGTGWVKARKGHYHDAIAVKRLRVILLLIEALGGITPRARSARFPKGTLGGPRAP